MQRLICETEIDEDTWNDQDNLSSKRPGILNHV